MRPCSAPKSASPCCFPRNGASGWKCGVTGTYLIDIAGKSIGTAPKRLCLGLKLEQLQKLNRKHFQLKIF